MKPIRDPAFWREMDERMNRVEELGRHIEEIERRKQEIKARLRAEQRPPNPPVDIRWNSVSVPVTSGPGGYTVTVAAPAARKRRRWRWL